MLDPKRGIALFTDGSSSIKDESGGWAWVAIDCFGGEEIGSGYVAGTTNNRMELTAWIEGLTYLSESLGPCDVLVYSDSQYVGFGAMDRTRKRNKSRDLWKLLDEAVDVHDYVEFVWVKGHAESHYNHLVDELAGNARRTGLDEQS